MQRRLIVVVAGFAPPPIRRPFPSLDAHARLAVPTPLAAPDGVTAARLRWRVARPLLALEVGRARPGDPTWPAVFCAVYARGATHACDLPLQLSAAAARLAAVAPKLRAKGTGAAIAALGADEAVSSGTQISGLSDRGLRRLFHRLVNLVAVCELTGRPTFRLYGF